MSTPHLLLWCDTESTGLLEDPISPTLLEASWCVTDTLGQQLTPLSQAFTALPTAPGERLVVPSLTEDTGGAPVAWWDVPERLHYPSDAVQEMHRANRLDLEWAQLAEGPDRGRILRDWSEFERLVLDDLDRAGWRGLDRHQVVLAGGGVSHYEHRFLPAALPRVFGDRRTHYAVCDVSTVLRTLRTRALADPGVDEEGGFPGTADRLIERYRPEMYSTDTDTRWANIDLDPRRYDAADRCGWTRRRDLHTGGVVEEVTEHWAVTEKDPHRAAPGIARALMAYRLLPRLFAESFYTFGSGESVPSMSTPPVGV